MWMTIISFIGGPVIKGLIDGYKAKLAAGNTSEKIASETASAEIAAQVSEINAIICSIASPRSGIGMSWTS